MLRCLRYNKQKLFRFSFSSSFCSSKMEHMEYKNVNMAPAIHLHQSGTYENNNKTRRSYGFVSSFSFILSRLRSIYFLDAYEKTTGEHTFHSNRSSSGYHHIHSSSRKETVSASIIFSFRFFSILFFTKNHKINSQRIFGIFSFPLALCYNHFSPFIFHICGCVTTNGYKYKAIFTRRTRKRERERERREHGNGRSRRYARTYAFNETIDLRRNFFLSHG